MTPRDRPIRDNPYAAAIAVSLGSSAVGLGAYLGLVVLSMTP